MSLCWSGVYATFPDILRLVVVPVLGWAAWRDIRTRRVPNRTWPPLAALGVILIAWDLWVATIDIFPDPSVYAIRVAFSIGILIPLAYGFWWIGGFGGADAKALMMLAILFPTYPTYFVGDTILPVIRPQLGVFALTILSNAVLVGLAYPLALAGRNALGGHVGKAMVIGRPISTDEATTEYGRLLESPDGFTRMGLDLDALRMYLSWRDSSLSDLREDPEHYRDPSTVPEDPEHPGDGSIPVADGGHLEDPWGAQAFLDDIDHSAYGTSPEMLREGLEVLATEETVWISPGIPFLVPMFGGLLVSLIVGDILVWMMDAIGLGVL